MIVSQPKQRFWWLITSLFFLVTSTFQPDWFLNLFHHAAIPAPELAKQMAQSKGEALDGPSTAALTGNLGGDEQLQMRI